MNRFRRLAIAVALTLLLQPMRGAAQPAGAPDTVIPPHADLVDTRQAMGGRLTVPVTINGSGPYAFFIDTGSERTIISRELARTLKLAAGPTARLHSLTGLSEVGTVIIPNLVLSSRKVKSIAAPAFAQGNIGGAGMLGIDSLKSQRVIFDFAAGRMAIAPAREVVPDYHGEIVVTAKTRLGRLVLADAEAHGHRVIMILDTGAEISMGNEALRRRLIGKRQLRETVPIRLSSITGEVLPADYTAISRVSIGDIRLRDMPVAFGKVKLFDELDLRERPAILLGMDVLSQFDRVSVDFAARQVRFALRRNPKLAARAR